MSHYFDPSRKVVRINYQQLFLNDHDGLLLRERNPLYIEDQRLRSGS
jgi:hypothetical protein